MKTTINIKKTIQVMLASAIIISCLVMTRNIVKHVKYQYSMLPAGSGKAFFYDMVQ